MKKLPSKILTDKVINDLSEEAENLYYRMVAAADGYGRLIDSLEVIMVTCYPKRIIGTRTLSRRVRELQDKGLIAKIVIENRPLLEINDFKSFNISRSDRQKPSVLDKPTGITTITPKPNPEIREFLRFWGSTWPEKVGNGHAYPFSYGKEGAIVKEMLRTISLEDLKNYAIKFFESTDQFIRNTGWTIGAFKMSLAKFLSNKEDGSWKEKFLLTGSKSLPSTLAFPIPVIGGKGG